MIEDDIRIYKYPYKHPNNCDNCKRDKRFTKEWSCREGCEFEVITCPTLDMDISYHYGNRDFIDAVGCPLFKGE